MQIWGLCIWGVRTAWRTESDGEFYCPECGGDRSYRRRGGIRRLTVLGVPLLRRGSAGSVVECSGCRTRYGLEALERPTSTRFSAMLRDAAYTVALAVLVAGGANSRRARQAATDSVRGAGFTDCAPEQFDAMLEALTESTGGTAALEYEDAIDGCGSWLSIELHEVLEPLAEHLAPQGRERILLEGARIALADGPYLPAERDALTAIGRCLLMTPENTQRVLERAERARS
ncbi:TerB family tellurite resistance protein [Streptomyces capparidis]